MKKDEFEKMLDMTTDFLKNMYVEEVTDAENANIANLQARKAILLKQKAQLEKKLEALDNNISKIDLQISSLKAS